MLFLNQIFTPYVYLVYEQLCQFLLEMKLSPRQASGMHDDPINVFS